MTDLPRIPTSPMFERDQADFEMRFARIDLKAVAEIMGSGDALAHPAFEDDLRAVMKGYRQSPEFLGPTRREITRELKKLTKNAEAFRKKLAEVDPFAWVRIKSEYEQFMPISEEEDAALYRRGLSYSDVELAALLEKLELLVTVAKSAAEVEPPAKRGPKTNETLYAFIQAMAAFYKQHSAGSKDASVTWDAYAECYSGKFLDLLDAVLYPFDPARKQEAASLGDAIRRAIGDRVKS